MRQVQGASMRTDPLAPDDAELVQRARASNHHQGGNQWHGLFRLLSQDEAWSRGWR